MKEANDHYIKDSLWEVENFLQSVSIDKNLLDERTLDDMAYHYYKNYYDYEMDEEYALCAAVSEVLEENDIVIEGFDMWLPYYSKQELITNMNVNNGEREYYLYNKIIFKQNSRVCI